MQVIFRTRQLRRNYESWDQAVRQWGRPVARRYVLRIAQFREIEDFYQLYGIPSLRLHPLRGSRNDELSIYLVGRWRLIVTRGDTEQSIIIEEVSNHYDD